MNDDKFSDVDELSLDSDGLVNLDEIRVIKRRKGPSIGETIKNLFDKYL